MAKVWYWSVEDHDDRDALPRDVINRKLSVPNAARSFFIRDTLCGGFTNKEIFDRCL